MTDPDPRPPSPPDPPSPGRGFAPPDPPPARVSDPKLAQAVRDELRAVRARGLIATELRFGQAAWNALSPEMRFAPFGGRRAVLFEGLPCVLAVGLERPFAVQTIAPRE